MAQTKKKSSLIIDGVNNLKSKETKTDSFKVEESKLNEIKESYNTSIPSEFIEVKLLSNGRIKNIPKVLHFRDFSSSEALDVTVTSEKDKVKKLVKILSNMNYEKFDCSVLPEQDILIILIKIIGTFVTSNLEKSVYINLDLPNGTSDGCLDNEKNIDVVNVPFSEFDIQYLGTNDKDEIIEPQIKIPMTLTDSLTNTKYSFKLPSIEDIYIATDYVKDHFKNDLKKHASFMNSIEKIKNSNSGDIDEKLETFIVEHFEESEQYRELEENITKTTAQMIESLQLVAVDGKELTTSEEKWNAFESLPNSLFKKYSNIIDNYKFGVKPGVKVFIPTLGHKEIRTFRLEIDDLLVELNNPKESNRYNVDFE